MNFMPAMRLSPMSSNDGVQDIAANTTGTTLTAAVITDLHCVYIYRVDETGVCTAAAVTVGTPGRKGSAEGQLCVPLFACFVHRNGTDTLLVGDRGNDRVVEYTVHGEFLRAIVMEVLSWPCGIAYCGNRDVIAVSLFGAQGVALLEYESGAVKREVTIGFGTAGNADGERCIHGRWPLHSSRRL
jgi:hypothetical protein